MESVSTSPPPGPVRAVPPSVAAGERTSAPNANRVQNVGVEYSHRSDGVQVVTFIDRRTGVVICQTPPQQVLAVIDSLVAAIQQREG
ncbi:MAG: hypothetical protein QOJ23_5947 [Actinomycetota bacterium]|nr:hypothetical protein [Actinomycetota bacterium]